MPLQQWPCVPDTFDSILPEDLSRFLQTGACAALGRAVSIIDPTVQRRIDALDRFYNYQSFCRCLRGGCENRQSGSHCDDSCKRCDLLVAQHLLVDRRTRSNKPSAIVRYRCYMGCEELATVIRVGGHPVIVVTGQYMPGNGIDDIVAAVSCLGKKQPGPCEISLDMWQSVQQFKLPRELWDRARVTEDDRQHLIDHAQTLGKAGPEDEGELLLEAERVAEIGQKYYDLAKARVESEIIRDVARAIGEGSTDRKSGLWERVDDALGVFKSGLGVQYVAFFAGETERDTVLGLKAQAGQMPETLDEELPPLFNWRKARLKTDDERDTSDQTWDWPDVHPVGEKYTILRGFRGPHGRAFSSAGAIVPVRVPDGPMGLVVVGPQKAEIDLAENEGFITTSCRELATRILTLRLAGIFRGERSDWEKTAKLTGHRVRASLQSIGSQLKSINAANQGEPGYTERVKAAAERDLQLAFTDLTEVSYAAESSVRGIIDVGIANRDRLPLAGIILAAAEAQRDVAEIDGILIDTKGLEQLHARVFVNETLIRYVFVNLVNNALKYSYPRPDKMQRVVNVKPAHYYESSKRVEVEVVNFGLGIKECDRERVFEWGERLVAGRSEFEERYGKGIGLWESKHIVEGHGGDIWVESVHHSKAPVTDLNIEQCITVFKVALRVG